MIHEVEISDKRVEVRARDDGNLPAHAIEIGRDGILIV
jgi:hypothetical protein